MACICDLAVTDHGVILEPYIINFVCEAVNAIEELLHHIAYGDLTLNRVCITEFKRYIFRNK